MWRKILTILVGVVLVVIIFQLFFRYKIVKIERKHGGVVIEEVYLFDRLTRKLSNLDPQEQSKEPDQEAIKLVKSLPGSAGSISDYVGVRIREQLSEMTGDVDFKGWTAKEVSKNTYLVSCTFLQNGKELGWWWEVNLNMKVVRPIISSWDYGKIDLDELSLTEVQNEDAKLAIKYKDLIPKDLKATMKVGGDTIIKK